MTNVSTLTRVVAGGSVDVVSLVFVLSAVDPSKFEAALKNIESVLKPGGLLIFRDYGLYDMAMFRSFLTVNYPHSAVPTDYPFCAAIEHLSRRIRTTGSALSGD